MTTTEELQHLAAMGNLRTIPDDTSRSCRIDFTSNDYLGIGMRSDLRQEFFETLRPEDMLMSASASRLLSRHQYMYFNLEETLKEAYGREALIFNSGYHANTGLVAALARPGYVIIADKLVHASIIDGMKLSGVPFFRFRHNDIEHARLLADKATGQGNKILFLVESIYSMDGDTAPLRQLVELKRHYSDSLLYVDEAHAVGVEGPSGLGLSMSLGEDSDEIDVIVGTFGKALCSVGAFALTNAAIKQWAVNKARSFIFSTALPPLNMQWSEFIFKKALDMEEERTHLKEISRYLGIKLGSGNQSHIQPIITGNPQKAVDMAICLANSNLTVMAIRTPTVPPGSERLRISLSASHTKDNIDNLTSTLSNYEQ